MEAPPGKKAAKRRQTSGDDVDGELPSRKKAARSKKRRALTTDGEQQVSSIDENDGAFGAEEKLLTEAAEHGRTPKRQPLSSPVTAALVMDDDVGAVRLFLNLQAAFGETGLEVTPDSAQPDLLVYFGAEQEMLQKGRRATVLIGELGGTYPDNRELARAAKAADAIVLPLQPVLRRFGGEAILDAGGALSESGAALLARGIRDSVLAQTGASPSRAPTVQPAEDLAEAVALSEDPLSLLRSLAWPAKQPPKSLGIPSEADDVQHFLDGAVLLASKGEKRPAPFYLPFNWSIRLSSRADEHRLYGLDFVASVLSYWLAKANRAPSRGMKQIDEAVKQRDIAASALLAGAGAVILDCIRATDSLPARAWLLPFMQRRARAFELFLVCCRTAALRQIAFDVATCGRVFRALTDLLERMRPAALPAIGAATAVAEHAVLIALALPLRKLRFGQALLEEAIEFLRLQLEFGMSADGVWQEGFPEHISVLDILALLAADLRTAEVSARFVSGPLTRLARFASVFLVEGWSPPIAELAPARYAKSVLTAQAVLKAAPRTARVQTFDGQDLRDTAFFPQAGYFISRVPKVEGKPASHLVLHARPASLGGPSLSFSLDRLPLLIGGGTTERKASEEIRRASRESPAAHNAIRVNGENYPGASCAGAIRIEKIWEEKRWSAARLINDAVEQARTARTVIHLKPIHGLLIVDELATNEGEAIFEQFWHLAPGLKQEHAGSASHFAVPEHGCLTIAFDGQADVESVKGGDGPIGWTTDARRRVIANPFIVRTKRADNDIIASLFRWSPKAIQADVHVQRGVSGWQVAMTGEGPQVRFAFENGQLKLLA